MAKQEVPEPDYKAILTALVDMRALEEKAAKGGSNYDAVRQVRRESGALWKLARETIYGTETPADAAPRSKAEQERWDRNAAKVHSRRGQSTEPQP